MKALVAQESAALLEKRAASDSRLPRVSVAGNWACRGVSASSSIPSCQYLVSLPLFTGGRIGAENARAERELKKLVQQIQDLTSRIVLEVRTAMEQLEAARHEVKVPI